MNTSALMENFPDSEEFMKGINKYYENKLFFQLPEQFPLKKLMGEIFHEYENKITDDAIDSLKKMEKFYMEDNVNNPYHYQSKSGLQVIDIIDEFEMNYNLGNVIKYVLRHTKKGGTEDLKKAIWYLNHEIESRECEEEEEKCLPF